MIWQSIKCIFGFHNWLYYDHSSFTINEKKLFKELMLSDLGFELKERKCKYCNIYQHYKNKAYCIFDSVGWNEGQIPSIHGE